MSNHAISPCPSCDSRLAPRLEDSTNGAGLFSVEIWVACPMCQMAGPRTYICLDGPGVDHEFDTAQDDAIRAWNRIAAACSTIDHLTQDGSQRASVVPIELAQAVLDAYPEEVAAAIRETGQ